MTHHRYQRPRRGARALCCMLAVCGAARSTAAQAANARAQLAVTGSTEWRTNAVGRAETRSELGAPTSKRAENTGDWGWFVVLPSLAAGATLLGYGLSIDCKSADTDCQRKASLAIWGSVGIASLGSLLGISIVEHGQSPALAHGSPSAAPERRRVRVELAPSSIFQRRPWPTGAVVQLTATLD